MSLAIDELAERRARDAQSDGDLDTTLAALMQAYGRDIFRYCYHTLRNHADAEDVTQTVFIQAHRGLESFSGDSTYRTWLYAIARHRCLDRLKTERRLHDRVAFTDEVPEQAADDDADDDGLKRILAVCLGRLSGEVRSAVVLRFQSDVSYAEMADIFQVKAGTLQARVARALPGLRRCVEEHGATL